MLDWGQNLLNAAKASGVKHIVRSSGSLADRNSSLKIEALLGATDHQLRTTGINYTITAPSFFMQNFINFFAGDYKTGAIYQPAGDEREAQFPDFVIEIMMSLNHSIRQGNAAEVTNTVEEVAGKPPISFRQFVDDHRDAWL